jgi:hypothetical protein
VIGKSLPNGSELMQAMCKGWKKKRRLEGLLMGVSRTSSCIFLSNTL